MVIFHKLLALNTVMYKIKFFVSEKKVSVSFKQGTTEKYKLTFTFWGKCHKSFVLHNLCLNFSQVSRNLSVESFADFENSKGKEWKERVSKQNKCGTRVQTSLWKFEKVSALFKKLSLGPKQLQTNNFATYVEQDSGEAAPLFSQ